MRDALDTPLRGVVFTPDMRQRVLRAVQAPGKPSPPPLRIKRAFIPLVAACLLVVFGVAAAAGVFPSFERFIAGQGEYMRALVQHVGVKCISNGINVEVVAAVNDGENAIVYLTLQDTAGNRLDATTELQHLEVNSFWPTYAQLVHYDEADGTATFRLEGSREALAQNGEMEIKLSSFLTGQTYAENVDTGLTLADIQAANPNPETFVPDTVYGHGFAYGASEETNRAFSAAVEGGTLPILALGRSPFITAPLSGFTLSNAGVVGQYLHLQQNPQGLEVFGNADVVLACHPADGGPAVAQSTPSAKVFVGRQYRAFGQDYSEYIEHILPLPSAPPEEVHVLLNRTSYTRQTTGNWQLRFRLDENPRVLAAVCNVPLGGYTAEKVSVSSIGVTLQGSGHMGANMPPLEIEVVLHDGTVVQSYSSSTVTDAYGTESYRNGFEKPVDLAKVSHVTINGTRISF